MAGGVKFDQLESALDAAVHDMGGVTQSDPEAIKDDTEARLNNVVSRDDLNRSISIALSDSSRVAAAVQRHIDSAFLNRMETSMKRWIIMAGLKGEPGDKGDIGSTGAPGIPGKTGFAGKHGRSGQTGYTGSVGKSGKSGAAGSAGRGGRSGSTGSCQRSTVRPEEVSEASVDPSDDTVPRDRGS